MCPYGNQSVRYSLIGKNCEKIKSTNIRAAEQHKFIYSNVLKKKFYENKKKIIINKQTYIRTHMITLIQKK